MTRHKHSRERDVIVVAGSSRHAVSLAAIINAFLALTCFAQTAKPDFTGHWVLDKEQSTLANPDAVVGITIDIKHAEPKIAIKRIMELSMGQGRSSIVVTTDGKWISDADMEKDEEPVPAGLTAVSGGESKTRAQWDGAKLVVNSVMTMEQDGATIEKDAVYSLSPDGKTLTIASVRRGGPQGEVKQTEIYRKQ